MGNAFSFAVRLLTIFPPLTWLPPTRAEARQAVGWFPLVGGLIGLLMACGGNIANRVWGGDHLITGVMTLVVGLLLTGGQSLGALARVADGLAAQRAFGDRLRAFAVIRDPRRGTTGLVALASAFGLQAAFLAALPPELFWSGLMLAGAVGRWAVAFSLTAFPLASASQENGDSAQGLADSGSQEFLIATGLTIVFAALLPGRGLLLLLLVGILTGLIAAALNRRFGGLSLPLAQAIGFAAEVCALAFLTIR